MEESFDLQELASEAAHALEAYQRAPGLPPEPPRIAELRRALELLRRIHDLEAARIPMPARDAGA